MKPTDLQSKVIAFMRFPLVVLLLFMHCNFTALGGEWASLPFASGFIHIVSQRIAPIANAFFFFISGYLFFKTGQFALDIYLKKLIRRLQSLFVPYVNGFSGVDVLSISRASVRLFIPFVVFTVRRDCL